MSAHDVKYPLAQRLLYIVFFSLCVYVLLMFRLEDSIPYSVTTHDAGRGVERIAPTLAPLLYEK